MQRAAAAGAAAGLAASAVAASVAQRKPPTSSYISELSVPGEPLSRVFRTGVAVAGATSAWLGISAVRAAGWRAAEADGGGPPARWCSVVANQPRAAALAGAGAMLVLAGAFPSSKGTPLPIRDGLHVPLRSWVHVPSALVSFWLWPVAARGRWRPFLAVNLAVLAPSALISPHGRATAVLQRTMVATAAGALACWSPEPPGVGPRARGAGRRMG